ncbi:MAG: FAD-dependent oxidoreductase [Candidatus Odinarchaeia archaeon]
MSRRIVIIGGGAAGSTAALWARKTDKNAQITVINDEKYSEYSRCGLPYVVEGVIGDLKEIMVHDFSWFTSKFVKINLLLETKATDVDVSKRVVEVKSLKDGSVSKLEYDSLVIATGSVPAIPPIKGLDKEKVYFFRTIDDCKNILSALGDVSDATIIGGGPIGVELAEAFYKRGINVNIVEYAPEILLATVDKDMAELVHKKLSEAGIKIYTNSKAEEITDEKEVKSVIVKNVKTNDTIEVKSDIVVVSTGVKPNVELAKKMGVEIGVTGAIKVNNRMETSIKDVYAAGDCIEFEGFISGNPTNVPLGTVTVREGKIAGINAANGNASMQGILCARVTKTFGLEVAAVGMTSAVAEEKGIKNPLKVKVKSFTKPEYFPSGKPIWIKIIAHPETGRIIGAQAIGEEGAALRIDVFSVAIQKSMTVEELTELDTCYSPPVSPTLDPIVIAAEAAALKFRKLKKNYRSET